MLLFYLDLPKIHMPNCPPSANESVILGISAVIIDKCRHFISIIIILYKCRHYKYKCRHPRHKCRRSIYECRHFDTFGVTFE